MFIEGDEISLRPMEREDLAQAKNWRNDCNVRKRYGFRGYKPLSMRDQEKWFESLCDGKNIMFAVIRHERFIGICGLCYIDQHNRSAELSWYIGNALYWGKGYDEEIIKLLSAYGFAELGLHRVFMEVYLYFTERIDQLEKCGFKKDGILRDVAFQWGRYWSSQTLSMLEEEWESTK